MKNIEILTSFIGFNRNYRVKTDQKRLQQVLLNLISNSIKFTNRNGTIKIKVELIKEIDEFQIQETKEYLQLIVKDNGIGI